MNEKIEAILEKYKGEMTEKLRELIRIPSVTMSDNSGCPPEAPFGPETMEAFNYMEALGRSKGFRFTNYDNMVCCLDFGEEADDAVGIVGHLDVVPVGGEWKHPPFGGELCDGRIYGRGALDDKGPTIAAFYAALAIKESGLPLRRNVTQIIGTNEEGGDFKCIRHYLDVAEKIPSWGIVPDSFFPICFSEKHFICMKFIAESKSAGESADADGGAAGAAAGGSAAGKRVLKTMRGGAAMNVVPAWAEAVFVDENGEETETIRETGVSAHASTPEQGENAIAKLINRLAETEFEPKDICESVKAMSELLCRDTDGSGLGIYVEDETGATTNNLGVISYENGVLEAEVNARLPLSLKGEKAAELIEEKLKGTGMRLEVSNILDGYYTDPEQEPAKTMIQVYREETGDLDSKPYANGSGSYARIMEGFVPFGAALQDEPLLFHVEDEYITEERLWMTARIYAEALYRLATM